MSVDTKKHIFLFIESLKVANRGHLYNMIKAHVEENPEKKSLDDFFEEQPIIVHKGFDESKVCTDSCEG